MNNVNWTQSLITAFFAIFVSVGGGMIIYKLQSQNAKLDYQIDKITPFKSQKENLSIYHIKVRNSGSKLAEDVLMDVNISPAIIKDYNIVSDFPVSFKQEKDSVKVSVSTSNLNPDESYDISILAITNKDFPNEPLIKLRARGVVGEKIDIESKDKLSFFQSILPSTLIPILTLFIFTIVKKKGIGEKHSDEQDKILAYLCGVHQLPNEVDRLLTLTKTPSYWSEADRLTSSALTGNKLEEVEKVRLVLSDVLNYAAIHENSIGIIYFNLAKIEKFLKNDQASIDYLDKAKKIIPKLIDTRLKIDPVFK